MFEEVQLSMGAHFSPEDGMCVMEMVAWFAGEPHSDRPACTSPVLTNVAIEWNDSVNDYQRNKYLKPLVPKLAGTFSEEDEQNRINFLLEKGLLLFDVKEYGFMYQAKSCSNFKSLSGEIPDETVKWVADTIEQTILRGKNEVYSMPCNTERNHYVPSL